jgi:hypothetical protein
LQARLSCFDHPDETAERVIADLICGFAADVISDCRSNVAHLIVLRFVVSCFASPRRCGVGFLSAVFCFCNTLSKENSGGTKNKFALIVVSRNQSDRFSARGQAEV